MVRNCSRLTIRPADQARDRYSKFAQRNFGIVSATVDVQILNIRKAAAAHPSCSRATTGICLLAFLKRPTVVPLIPDDS